MKKIRFVPFDKSILIDEIMKKLARRKAIKAGRGQQTFPPPSSNLEPADRIKKRAAFEKIRGFEKLPVYRFVKAAKQKQ
jgi:hypothetical protein